ncbi:cytochrome c [Azonexus sp.]|jgi:cytochrome c556|uniref:c-type cytochrome n=1 Tax=Azonexus sp. TaxID=1872668 RepID=UPI00281811A4|nr:cytochrome c [Azonexus sp.]MDR1994277.1 cytochrome c [Azonexus sp.]
MRFALPAALFLSATTLLTACSGEVEDTRPGQPVKTRQQAFKAMIRSFEPMGVMLRGKTYDADKFLTLANELVAQRDAPWAHFGPDTNYPPTKATAEVWQLPEKFAQDRQAFIAAIDTLLVAAQTKDRKQLDAPYQAVYDACQSCHKTFKQR